MMLQEQKARFEAQRGEKIYDSAVLTFHGVPGWDVYNCSVPFQWNGKEVIFGRVERRGEWANSWVALFEQTGCDEYTRVADFRTLQLEDPFISVIHGEMVLGGTHVRKRSGEIDTYYGYFYRGKDLNELTYFTTGPNYMKDIRLVEMPDGRIGVFSRPRNEQIEKLYGSAAVVGFTVINNLNELTDEVILNAPPIPELFGKGEWGGCNQPIMLQNGHIGVISHHSFSQDTESGVRLSVYMNTAFEFDPVSFTVTTPRIIGTRDCYPAGPAKRPDLTDCTFTSGIVLRADGKADLYGGIGDVGEGRIAIDYPFSAPPVGR